jgi:hypothetical protein
MLPLAVLSVLAVACARSAVPTVSVDALPPAKLSQLDPRELAVVVEDLRPVDAKDRSATEQHLGEVLGEWLAASDVRVHERAPQQLFVRLQEPLSDTVMVDPSWCVHVQSELAVLGVHSPSTGTTRCSYWSQGSGARFGSGTLAIEGAMQQVLEDVDLQLRNVMLRFAEPRFDAERIRMPEFGWLKPREVSLVVKDELSGDGESGRSLERALGFALTRSGVKVADGAHCEITWVLQRPAAPVDAISPEACRQVVVNWGRPRAGSRSITSYTCGSPSANDDLVSHVLETIDREGL